MTVAARPVVEQVVAQLVATDAFQGVFHAGVRELHSSLVEGSRSSLVVDVDDTAQLVRHSLAAANPTIADAIPDRGARRRRRDLPEHPGRHDDPRRLARRMAGGDVRRSPRGLPGVGRPPGPRPATGRSRSSA